jgi:hypothetical protein
MIIIARMIILLEIFFTAKASTLALIYRSFSGQEMICPFLLTGTKRFSIFQSQICNGRYYLFATIKIMKNPDAR